MDRVILTSATKDSLVNEITGEILARIEILLKTKLLSQPSEIELLTRKEVANLLKVTTVTVSEWSRRGILKPKKIGTRIRYEKAEVLAAFRSVEAKRV